MDEIYIVSAEVDLGNSKWRQEKTEYRCYEEVIAPVFSYEEAEKVIKESYVYAANKGYKCFFVCCYSVVDHDFWNNVIRWRRYDKDLNIISELKRE